MEALVRDGAGKLWYRTGDVCYIRGDTKEWIMVGRAAEVFKTSAGLQVSPAEIESLLLKHDEISDAAIGLSQNGSGLDVIKAWIRLKADVTDMRGEKYLKYLHGKVEDGIMPQLITFVDEIPRNAAGKIMRREVQLLK